jgi:hypothetical protein
MQQPHEPPSGQNLPAGPHSAHESAGSPDHESPGSPKVTIRQNLRMTYFPRDPCHFFQVYRPNSIHRPLTHHFYRPRKTYGAPEHRQAAGQSLDKSGAPDAPDAHDGLADATFIGTTFACNPVPQRLIDQTKGRPDRRAKQEGNLTLHRSD